MNKIAVFGSAFNPPSLGHKSVIESISHFDLILLVPSIAHAWGKSMLDYRQRCQLVDAFIEDLDMTFVERSCIEEDLVEPGKPVTTYDVLDQLSARYPEADLTFILGPDNLFSFEKFYRSKDIVKRFSVLACPETVPVRSSDIRQHLEQDQPIIHLTTPNVAKLIGENAFYKTTS